MPSPYFFCFLRVREALSEQSRRLIYFLGGLSLNPYYFVMPFNNNETIYPH